MNYWREWFGGNEISRNIINFYQNSFYPLSDSISTTIVECRLADTLENLKFKYPIKSRTLSNRENMESFALFRQHLAISGIVEQQLSPQTPHSFHLKGFNLKNSTIIILSGFYVISLAKLLDEVSTFEEYMSIIYIVLSSFVLIFCYIIIVWTTPELFELAGGFEKIITNRE